MKRAIVVLTLSVVPLWAGLATAQTPAKQTAPPVAGRAPLGVTIVEMEAIVVGWSAKKDLLGKTVINDKRERIGKIDDLIISPSSSDTKTPFASFAIIGVGGFLGVGTKEVAVPSEQVKLQGTDLVLPGATKDALKALPEFKYAPKR
jgi:sporulation protein YlmC with PRC-barrel domain